MNKEKSRWWDEVAGNACFMQVGCDAFDAADARRLGRYLHQHWEEEVPLPFLVGEDNSPIWVS